jgi:hypothetical protein
VSIYQWVPVNTNNSVSGFPRPCVITVGVLKGGDCKTWLALNLAGRLGCMGYRVTAIDLNETNDLYSDWKRIVLSGLSPRFDAVSLPPITPELTLRKELDLSEFGDQQFIILDTAQFIRFHTTNLAWSGCNLMIMPVTPAGQEVGNYLAGINHNRSMRGQRPPMAVLPCKVNRKGNRVSDQKLEALLRDWESLAGEGIFVPPRGVSDISVPDEEAVKTMDTRWIYSVTEHKGRVKALSTDFLIRVDVSLGWIIHVLQRCCGQLPVPELEPISVNPFERPVTVKKLKELRERERQQEVAAGMVRAED